MTIAESKGSRRMQSQTSGVGHDLHTAFTLSNLCMALEERHVKE